MSNYYVETYKYLIDFHGASHGHFLEYVINTWIYNGPRVEIFTNLGTSHLPRKNPIYQEHRMIKCGHFTEYNISHDAPEKVVRITVNGKAAQQIHIVNVMYRSGDVPLETKYKMIPLDVVDNPSLLRTNWFSKFTDAEHIYKLDYEWLWPQTPAFEFPMDHLYDLTAFYQTLQQCADFLEQRFTPDQELCAIWKKFIEMNQGLQCYKKSRQIVESALTNQDFVFDSNESEQALINVMLTDTVNLYDGPLFEDHTYPTNAKQIWQHIQRHINEFDDKF